MNYLFFFGKKNFNSFLFFFVNVLLNRYHDLTMNIRMIYQISQPFSQQCRKLKMSFWQYLLHLLCTIAL